MELFRPTSVVLITRDFSHNTFQFLGFLTPLHIPTWHLWTPCFLTHCKWSLWMAPNKTMCIMKKMSVWLFWTFLLSDFNINYLNHLILMKSIWFDINCTWINQSKEIELQRETNVGTKQNDALSWPPKDFCLERVNKK